MTMPLTHPVTTMGMTTYHFEQCHLGSALNPGTQKAIGKLQWPFCTIAEALGPTNDDLDSQE